MVVVEHVRVEEGDPWGRSWLPESWVELNLQVPVERHRDGDVIVREEGVTFEVISRRCTVLEVDC